MKTTENTNTKTNKKKMSLWDISKSISLMAVALAISGAALGWQPFADTNRETVSPYAVETTVNAETDEAHIEAPYTSIYDVYSISDAQFNRILKHLKPSTVRAVSEDMGPNCSPKEWLLRYAAYNCDELEEVLNATVSMTLAADWRTSQSYVPTDEEEVYMDNNGHYYNGYGDNN